MELAWRCRSAHILNSLNQYVVQHISQIFFHLSIRCWFGSGDDFVIFICCSLYLLLIFLPWMITLHLLIFSSNVLLEIQSNIKFCDNCASLFDPFSLRMSSWKKMWNASRFCVSSLRRGHANLLCIVPILVYVLLWWRNIVKKISKLYGDQLRQNYTLSQKCLPTL